MELVHRSIDFEKDRDYILERHCRINYACESAWAREISYSDYRAEWFSLKSQVSGFYGYLERTAQDNHSIAEIIETQRRKSDSRGNRFRQQDFHSNV